MSLPQKITQLRKKRGWTQEYLAEKLGIQKTQVTRWETARSRPSMKTLKKLAPLLGVATDELLDEQASGLPEGGPVPNSEAGSHWRQLLSLPPEDQALVFRVIETFSKQQQLTQVLMPSTTARNSA